MQISVVGNILVEVVDYGDVERRGAGIDPILAQLVAVPGMHWLNGVSQIVEYARESLKGPAFAPKRFPPFAVIFERAKRDQCIMR